MGVADFRKQFSLYCKQYDQILVNTLAYIASSVTRFGENITLVQNFKMVILCIWQNFEPNLFQIYYCNWSNFRCCKWPNIEKEI